MKNKQTSRWLAVTLAVCIALTSLITVFAEILPKAGNVDFNASLIKGMAYSGSSAFPRHAWTTNQDYTANGNLGVNNPAALTDGNTGNPTRFYSAANVTDGNYGTFLITYDLGDFYDLTQVAYVGSSNQAQMNPPAWSVYAGEEFGAGLFEAANKTEGTTVTYDAPQQVVDVQYRHVRYVSFVMTPSANVRCDLHVAELAVFGAKSDGSGGGSSSSGSSSSSSDSSQGGSSSETPVEPTDPSDYQNLIYLADGQGVLAPSGVIPNTKDVNFVSISQGQKLTYLTDGDRDVHIDIYGFNDDDLPGIRYDLGSVRDIGKLSLYVMNVEGIAINGVKIYASETLDDLYADKNCVYTYDGTSNYPAEHTAALSPTVKARYVTFFLTSTQGGWRVKECEIYGSGDPLVDPSDKPDTPDPTDPDTGEDPPEPSGPNLIAGMAGQGIGVVGDDFTKAKDFTFSRPNASEILQLTDGNRTAHVDFYGGIGDAMPRGMRYDLGANYDLDQVRMYVFDNPISIISGVRVYASESLETLYEDSSLIYRSEYNVVNRSLKYKVLAQPKRARYVAFLMTQTTPANGVSGWRAMEFEVYGTPLEKKTITVGDPGASGTVSGGGVYPITSTVTLTATANPGYRFVAWKGADGQVLSTERSYSFVVSEDLTVTPVFEQIPYTVSVQGEGGSVDGAGDYHYGDTVTLTAAPAQGYTFAGFVDNGLLVETSPYTFTVRGNSSVTALFVKNQSYRVIFTDIDGRVLKTQTVEAGMAAQAPAQPVRYGYTFTGWDREFSSVTGDMTVKACYEKTAQFTISAENGLISGLSTAASTASFQVNDSCTVVANAPGAGQVFLRWEDAQTGTVLAYTQSYRFLVTRDLSLRAVYGAAQDGTRLPFVTLTGEPVVNKDLNKISFYAQVNGAVGYEILEFGVLLLPAEEGQQLPDITMETAGVLKGRAAQMSSTGQFSVTKANVEQDQTYAGRAYVVYRDVAAGTVHTAYCVNPQSAINGIEASTVTMEQAAGKYKFMGRTVNYNSYPSEGIIMDWSASGIEFNAYCRGNVTLSMDIHVYDKQDTAIYYTVYVDGVLQERMVTRPSQRDNTERVSLTIATGLKEGNHSFQVYRQTENSKARIVLKEITLRGTLQAAPANQDLLIEFLGDSVIAGFGNLGSKTDYDPQGCPLYQDGTQSYAVLTAKALQADYSVMAISGTGLLAGNGGRSNNLPKYYPFVNGFRGWMDPNKAWQNWQFERQADVVVVNLGANDWNNKANWTNASADWNITDADIKAAAADFINTIKAKNGSDVKIVWAWGMTGNACRDLIQAQIDEMGGSGSNLYTITLPNSGGPSGTNGHPTVAEHEAAAQALSQFIRDTVLAK